MKAWATGTETNIRRDKCPRCIDVGTYHEACEQARSAAVEHAQHHAAESTLCRGLS